MVYLVILLLCAGLFITGHGWAALGIFVLFGIVDLALYKWAPRR
jgi:hypothetical protein